MSRESFRRLRARLLRVSALKDSTAARTTAQSRDKSFSTCTSTSFLVFQMMAFGCGRTGTTPKVSKSRWERRFEHIYNNAPVIARSLRRGNLKDEIASQSLAMTELTMKLLVCGGAGFIGSNFIHYVLAKYDDVAVVNFDKLTYAGNPDNVRGVEDDPRYAFERGDICDFERLDEVVQKHGITHVI